MTTPPPRTPGRPRRTETDKQIVRATQELIREQGPAAVNVAAVSARSGVARTTIYRRHRDRQALLTAALTPVTERGQPPAAETVHGKFLWVLERTREVVDSGIGPGGVAAVLTDSDPDFSAALRDALEHGVQPILEQIASDSAEGRLHADVDPEQVLDLAIGAHLAQRLRHGTPDKAWRERTAGVLTRLFGDSSEARTMGP